MDGPTSASGENRPGAWKFGTELAPLSADRYSSTVLVEAADGRQQVARIFRHLPREFHDLIPMIYRQHRRLRVRGLVKPTALHETDDGWAWLHQPDVGTPLNQHAFSVGEALTFGRDLLRMLDGLHGAGLFGVELCRQQLFVERERGSVRFSGLVLAPEVWSIRSGFDELVVGEMDSSVDHRALGDVMVGILEHADARSVDQRGQRDVSMALYGRMAEGCSSAPFELRAGLRSPPTREVASLPMPGRVGRDALLRELEAIVNRRLDNAAIGGPCLVAITGRSGAGKTTVLTELVRRARDGGRRVLAARATASDRRILGPVADLVADLADPAPSVPRELGSLSPAAARRRSLELALRRFLEQVADRPTVLIVEDIDRAPTPSLDGLSYLVREVSLVRSARHIAIVVSLRTGEGEAIDSPASRLVDELREDGFAERMRLAPLDAADADTMARSLGLDVDDEIQATVANAAGNPRLLDRFARLLLEDGDAELLPVEFDELLQRRLFHAGEGELRVLEAVAVLDRPSELGLVAALCPARSKAMVLATVMRLIRRRLLRPVRALRVELQDPEAGALLRSQIGARRSRALHRRAGAELLARGCEDSEQLARHFELGGDRDRFIEFGGRAAAELESANANEASLALYERLLAAVGDGRRELKLSLLERLASLRGRSGDAGGAIDAYEELLRLPHDPERTWQYHKALGRALRDDEQLVSAGDAFDRGLASLRGDEELRVADLLSEKAYALMLQGEADTARGLAEMAGALAEQLPQSQTAAEIRNRVGGTFFELGDSARGVRHFEAGLKVSESVGALELAARAHNNLGLQLGYRGDESQRGIEHCLSSLAIWERLGDQQRIAQTSANIGALYLRAYDVERAEPFLERGLRAAQRFGRSFVVLQCMLNLAELNQMRGRLGKSLEIRTRVLRLAEQLEQPRDYGEQLFALSRDYLQLGDDAEAERMALQLEELAKRLEDPRLRALALWGLAGVARLRGERDVARTQLVDAGDRLSQIDAQEHQLMCLLDRADLELEVDAALAEELARQAMECARLLKLHVDRAIALLIVSESCLDRDLALARQAMREAEGLAQELDQPDLRWRCEFVAGEVALRSGDVVGAQRRFCAAREVLEHIVAEVNDPDLRYRYMRERRRVSVLRRARARTDELQDSVG